MHWALVNITNKGLVSPSADGFGTTNAAFQAEARKFLKNSDKLDMKVFTRKVMERIEWRKTRRMETKQDEERFFSDVD